MAQKILVELKSILFFILPQKKKEICIYLFFFFLYFSLGLYLTFNSYLLDFPAIIDKFGEIRGLLYDPYFSYDANHYYHQGYQNIIGHPLVEIFSSPFLLIGKILSILFGSTKAKTVFLVLCTSQMIALSVVYIHRYLEQVVVLSGVVLNLFVLFFAFFSTNIILSFTFESFCFSAFLLSLSCTYYSIKMKKQEETSFLADALFFSFVRWCYINKLCKGSYIYSLFDQRFQEDI